MIEQQTKTQYQNQCCLSMKNRPAAFLLLLVLSSSPEPLSAQNLLYKVAAMNAIEVPGNDADKKTWQAWIEAHTNTTNKGEDDFGLSRIAQHLGESQTQALALYWEGAARESDKGDVEGAIKLYRRAFKLWPA
jgi:hypothetical protein